MTFGTAIVLKLLPDPEVMVVRLQAKIMERIIEQDSFPPSYVTVPMVGVFHVAVGRWYRAGPMAKYNSMFSRIVLLHGDYAIDSIDRPDIDLSRTGLADSVTALWMHMIETRSWWILIHLIAATQCSRMISWIRTGSHLLATSVAIWCARCAPRSCSRWWPGGKTTTSTSPSRSRDDPTGS
jgi:hypothetical protein